MNIAVMWSTGFWKKPCTWPAWRSIVSTRSAPAASSMWATRRALIGSRGGGLLVLAASSRTTGVTAITRWAEAPTAASIITSSSISASLALMPVAGLPHVGWTMKTSAPRIDSS